MLYVFDIDGTLSLVEDRLKYLEQNPKNWDSFYDACWQDKPNTNIIELCKILMDNEKVIFLTGRRENCRQITSWWLKHHAIGLYTDRLLMRPDGNFEHDAIVKPELLQQYLIDHEIDDKDVTIFEDRDSMVKKWRELGYTCLQVAEGNF